MSRTLSAEWLPRSADAEWSRFVSGSPTGSAYSQPAYLDALTHAAGGSRRVLAVRKGRDLVGGVTVYERGTRVGTVVRPRLLLFYNGLVLREETTAYPSERTSRLVRLAEEVAEALEGAGYARVELRTRAPFDDVRAFQSRGWRAWPSYSYVVPLTDIEAQWARTEQNLRRLVGRCERNGFRLDDAIGVEQLYELHAATHERTAAPLYLPRERFAEFFGELREAGLARIFGAVAPDGRVAAAQLVLLGHPVTHTVVAATRAELASTGAAAFLRWKVFEQLAGEGYVANDLTDASLNPVTHFKSQLGGSLETAFVVAWAALRERAASSALGTARRVRARVQALKH